MLHTCATCSELPSVISIKYTNIPESLLGDPFFLVESILLYHNKGYLVCQSSLAIPPAHSGEEGEGGGVYIFVNLSESTKRLLCVQEVVTRFM